MANTIKNSNTRETRFRWIFEDYINGNLSDCRHNIKRLSGVDVVRFITWLRHHTDNKYTIEATPDGELGFVQL